MHHSEPAEVLRAMGGRLRTARLQAGLSQEAVAHRAGCAARSVTRWETGRCDPGITMVLLLAELYGVSLNWLLLGSGTSVGHLPRGSSEH